MGADSEQGSRDQGPLNGYERAHGELLSLIKELGLSVDLPGADLSVKFIAAKIYQAGAASTKAPIEETLHKLCAFTFWLNKLASSASDVATGESMSNNPHKDLEHALNRINSMSRDWLLDLNPLWSPDSGGNVQSSL